MKIAASFYHGGDVLQIAKGLLGKALYTLLDEKLCSGLIVETEAYSAKDDKASHAYLNRRTKRTETMYAAGGLAYIYLCYGIHSMFNVVCNEENIPDAVLVRAIQPLEGIEYMQERRNMFHQKPILTAGPGSVCKALGIHTAMDREDLNGNRIWIEDHKVFIEEDQILCSPRVGVGYAQEDALLPWRFRIKNNLWCSKAK